jgi:hypothetical protein
MGTVVKECLPFGLEPHRFHLVCRKECDRELGENADEMLALASLRDGSKTRTHHGNLKGRPVMIELAWTWLRYQPGSALSRWFQARVLRFLGPFPGLGDG